ncbi:MAG: restriction endonuclease subunit S [Pseudomonadota bacterium]|nr:restriction endonuclease subunit S [Pseudomonadota bacterium]
MNGWRVRKLGDICEFKPSKRQARAALSDDDPVSFVPMNDLSIGQKYFEASEERPFSDVAGSYTYFADGDVLLAKITPCFENGKLGVARGLVNGIGFGSSEFTVIRPGRELVAEYLYYFLDRDEVRERGANAMTGAVGHKRVPQEFVEALEIPLPPLEEQRRLVAVLDEAFAAIATAMVNAEKNLANARELFALGVPRIMAIASAGARAGTLGRIAGRVFTGPFGSLLHKRDYVAAGIPLVNPSHIDNGRIVPSDDKCVSSETAERLSSYRMKVGDIVFGRRGEMGRCAVVTESERGFLCGTGSFFIRPLQGTDPHYLAHLLRSEPYRKKIEALASGATMPNLSNSALADLLVALPDYAAQQVAVSHINALDAEIARVVSLAERKIAQFGALKQSLLCRAVSGKPIGRQLLAA